MTKLFRFLLTPYRKKKLITLSGLFIVAIRLSLWMFPFNWLNKRLMFFGRDTAKDAAPDWLSVNEIAGIVKAVSRYIPYCSCLTQALAVRTLLRMRGISSELTLGVDKSKTENFEAHAWVEISGVIIIGKLPLHDNRFAVLRSSDSVFL